MEGTGRPCRSKVCGHASKRVSPSYSPIVQTNLGRSDVTRISFAELVSSALATAPKESFIPSNESEDDDQWLNVDAADFEAMLQKNAPKSDKAEDAMDVDDQAGQSNTEVTEEDRLAQEQTATLQSLAEKVSSFVEGKGDLEGAKFDECVY